MREVLAAASVRPRVRAEGADDSGAVTEAHGLRHANESAMHWQKITTGANQSVSMARMSPLAKYPSPCSENPPSCTMLTDLLICKPAATQRDAVKAIVRRTNGCKSCAVERVERGLEQVCSAA